MNVLPGAEVFPALEKKVIDATEYSLPVIDEKLGFHKLVKYNYFPGWHQQSTTFELLINMAVWNALSPAQRAIIELACRSQIVQAIADGEAGQAAVMQRNAEENGVHQVNWSPDLLSAFEQKWLEVVAEQVAADPFFRKVWEDYSAFRKEYAIWGSRAYLP